MSPSFLEISKYLNICLNTEINLNAQEHIPRSTCTRLIFMQIISFSYGFSFKLFYINKFLLVLRMLEMRKSVPAVRNKLY